VTGALLLALALCLDAVMGEPRWLWARIPHPAVLMGRAVAAFDGGWNKGANQRARGAAALLILILIVGGVAWVLQQFGGLVTLLIAAILLAHRSLSDHVAGVAAGLRQSDAAGRRAVSKIVSRDVAAATPSATARSAIESLAENFSDGVIAPAFWFLVAGLPGIAIYKLVNTADSMIGYQTPRHAEFGWAAARLDDGLNWVPARVTALLIALVGFSTHRWSDIAQDARLHRSPNAGWPEAAMAYTMGIALAGPRTYHGELKALAWVNGGGRRALTPPDIDDAISIVWKAWGLAVAVTGSVGVLLWVF